MSGSSVVGCELGVSRGWERVGKGWGTGGENGCVLGFLYKDCIWGNLMTYELKK